jgi:ribosome-associated protein
VQPGFSAAHPEEIGFEFIRAAGPGGQNVNKVATAARLRFDVANSPSLGADVRARLIRIAGRRVDADGVLTLLARRHRTQEANRRDALERLDDMVRAASAAPKPRKPTRPSRAARERRLESKRRRARLKSARRGPGRGDQ